MRSHLVRAAAVAVVLIAAWPGRALGACPTTNPVGLIGWAYSVGGYGISLDVAGNYAFFADFIKAQAGPYVGVLQTFNVTDPCNPVLVAGSARDRGNEIGELALSGNRVYLANDGDGLTVYDVSTPTAPAFVSGKYDGGGYAHTVSYDPSANATYVGYIYSGRIVRYDMASFPSVPTDNLSTGAFHLTKVFAVGEWVYAFGDRSGSGLGSFYIFNRTPSGPLTKISEIQCGSVGGPGAFCAGPAQIQAQGNYAYVANSDTGGGLRVVDVSNKWAPFLVGRYDLPPGAPATASWRGGAGLAVAGNRAYMLGRSALYVFDISSPTTPAVLTTFPYPAAFGVTWGGGLVVKNNLAYVAIFSERRNNTGPSKGGLAIYKLYETNQPPTVDAGGPYFVGEGGSTTVTATGNDPDAGDVLTYTWDLDADGTFETPGRSATFSAASLDGPASRVINVRVTDSGGLTAEATATVDVTNVPPMISYVSGPTAPVNMHQAVNVGVAFDDPGTADTHRVTWAWGDGSSNESGLAAGIKQATMPHSYARPGRYPVAVTVVDKDGGLGTGSYEITSFDPLPVVSAGGPYALDEGGSLALSGVAADDDPLALTWSVGSALCTLANPSSLRPTLSCRDNVSCQVTLTASDGMNPPVSSSAAVTVSNVAPTIRSLSAPIGPVSLASQPVRVDVTFDDPARSEDTYTVRWQWDDGGPDDTQTSATSPASATHSYAVPGVYGVTVTVTDHDGATDSRVYEYIVVYDPSGGFVTGGGWINSPAGAYRSNLTLTGKATFGFVAKYQKGATVPSGETEFQFKVANLNFHSTSYDWLVVAGAKAQYKGVGTINGQGSYKFLLTGIDADVNMNDAFLVDRFRIRIWSPNGTTETVVYDNALGSEEDMAATLIGGGSITIHR